MKFKVYEYIIKDEFQEFKGSFTLKENAKHSEIVKILKAHLVDVFEVKNI